MPAKQQGEPWFLMTQEAKDNTASTVSNDEPAHEDARSEDTSGSSCHAAPEPTDTRVRSSRMARVAVLATVLMMLFAASVFTVQAFNVEIFDTDHDFSFAAPDVKVVETMLDPAGYEVPADQDGRINAGCGPVSRIVRVQNTGTHPLYVRVALSVGGVRENGDVVPLDAFVTYGFGDESAWQRGQDGRYYLSAQLEPSETTPVLVSSFEVESEALEDISRLSLHIVADGVQSEHNSDSSLTAEGWPA